MNAIDPLSTPSNHTATATGTPTLADARAAIAGWTDITPVQRANFGSAISGIARICALPEAAVALDCASLNQVLYRDAPAASGFTAQRFGKICRMLRQIMRRMGLHAPDLPNRDGLTEAWCALFDSLTKYRRAALSSFISFCSISGIAPEQVDDQSLARFEAWLATETICEDSAKRARHTASNWAWACQAVPGWPQVELQRPGMRRQYTLPFDAYPVSFQQDVDAFSKRLAGDDDDDIYGDDDEPRRRGRPLRPRTIEGRRDQIRHAAAALVLQDIPIEQIRSLRDLVEPIERPKMIRKFYRDRHGKEPNAQVCGILECLRQIAAHHCRLPEAAVERIATWAADARPDWEAGMTEKNRQRLQALIQLEPRAKLLAFPQELVARAMGDSGPIKRKKLIGSGRTNDLTSLARAKLVSLAVAIEILLVFPMRRANLAGLRLDRQLRWLNPGRAVSHIFLSAAEMKNRNGMDWPLPAETADLIEYYLREHRPLLAAPGNQFLFPGPRLAGRSAHELAISIKGVIERELGLKINLHLLRHFAAWLYLKRNPGAYEVVRRILGHKNSRVTQACYTGLELDSIAAHYDTAVLAERKETEAIAQAAFARPGLGKKRQRR